MIKIKLKESGRTIVAWTYDQALKELPEFGMKDHQTPRQYMREVAKRLKGTRGDYIDISTSETFFKSLEKTGMLTILEV